MTTLRRWGLWLVVLVLGAAAAVGAALGVAVRKPPAMPVPTPPRPRTGAGELDAAVDAYVDRVAELQRPSQDADERVTMLADRLNRDTPGE